MEVPGEGMKESIKRVWGATPGLLHCVGFKKRTEQTLKTIKQAIEESPVHTAITKNGSIYKQSSDGSYQRVCEGATWNLSQKDLEADEKTIARFNIFVRPLQP